MPLNPSDLANALKKLGQEDNTPEDRVSAAKRFVEAYDSYASGAQGAIIPSPFLPTGAEKGKMLAPLLPCFLTPTGNPVQMANAFVTGITAYWAGAIFSPKVPTPGSVGVAAPPVGGPALLSALLALFSVPQNPLDLAMTQLATALDGCTRTVVVTFVQPPPAPPIVSPIV